MLFLTESHIRSLLPMADCIQRMREAFQGMAAGSAQNQPRRRLILPSGSALHSMAGSWGSYFGTKIYSTNPKHGANFFFLLFEADTGCPLAMMEANYLGQIRTGAASGLATDLLALPGAKTLGVIGSGFQARSQVQAVQQVRPIGEIRVWSRDPEKRRSFAETCASPGVLTRAVDSAEAAVRNADVVITATSARDPVLEEGWIAPGCHVNAMGSNQARRREIPAGLLHRASVIAVDSVEQARIEAGDLLIAWNDGNWNSPKLVELQDLVGRKLERPAESVTIFKSLGVGVEDVAAGALVYERARELGLGKEGL